MKVYQAINGQIFRSESEAKAFYGERFDSYVSGGMLVKIIVDEDGVEIGEW